MRVAVVGIGTNPSGDTEAWIATTNSNSNVRIGSLATSFSLSLEQPSWFLVRSLPIAGGQAAHEYSPLDRQRDCPSEVEFSLESDCRHHRSGVLPCTIKRQHCLDSPTLRMSWPAGPTLPPLGMAPRTSVAFGYMSMANSPLLIRQQRTRGTQRPDP